ncbi:hypothetical protein NDN08_002862 [Rhodosorus marinus]|uniref:Tetratricopeptide repeat protein 27 n=1 Tax=Rhodosorus marinus TaxID=101924 RepID=A0AAV8UWE3_9RHOD|nr:hypothetical protein NDN08_002862 [Rhodosorus marinus]
MGVDDNFMEESSWETGLALWQSPPEAIGFQWEFVREVVEGRFSEALRRLKHKVVERILEGSVSSFEEDGDELEHCFLASVVLLRMFQRDNICGPSLTEDELAGLEANTRFEPKDDELDVDGEIFGRSVRHTNLLLAIRRVLVENERKLSQRFWSATLWSARAGRTHQDVLTGPSPTLKSEVQGAYTSALKSSETRKNPILGGLVHIEMALASNSFLDSSTNEKHLKFAMDTLHTKIELSGALGVRTKWQKEAKANLVAQVLQEGEEIERNLSIPTQCKRPRNIPLEDTDVLGFTKLSTDQKPDNERTTPTVMDHFLLSAKAESVAANLPSGQLTTEEIRPYLNRVLDGCEESTPPLVLGKVLLFRTRGELGKGRYAERSMKQVEELVDYYKQGNPIDDCGRLIGLEASGYPAMWKLQKEFAILLGTIGLVKAASEIFEGLGLWDEVIDCQRLMGNEQRARVLIEKRLDEEGERPWLLAAMGEVTRDEKWYVKAWEVSKGRYAKAMRLLGRLLISKNENQRAVSALEDALKINFLYPDAWFLLAHAAQKCGDIEKYASSLTTAVQLDGSNAEAWNNLGSAQLQLGKPQAAVTALQQAAKLRRESWRVWENLLLASIAANAVRQMIQAMDALQEIRGREGVSAEGISAAIVEIERLGESGEDDDGRQTADLARRLLNVLGRASALVSTEPAVWNAYARLHELGGDHGMVLENRKKEMRSVLARASQNYASDLQLFEIVARAAMNLGYSAIREGSEDAKLSALLQVNSIVTASETNFADTDYFRDLKKVADQLSATEDS